MSWASNDQREAVDGTDAEGWDMYPRGARDLTGIRFELDVLVVTLALGGALLDTLLLHTLRTQLRSTLASSEPTLQQPGGESSTAMLMARRASWGGARMKFWRNWLASGAPLRYRSRSSCPTACVELCSAHSQCPCHHRSVPPRYF